MMAAQLIAAHNAVMERYRRASINGQTFEVNRPPLFAPLPTFKSVAADGRLWPEAEVG